MDISKQELSYSELKTNIRNGLSRVAEGFVEIGYYLREVRDRELYKEDGYDNINDFAQDMYGLSQSNTSRFIAINEHYSVGGNSPKLLPEYEGYGSSKLSEMLTLSEEEMKLVSIRSTVAEIRTIKEAKKEAEELDNYATSHSDESLDNTQLDSNLIESETSLEKKIIIEFFRDQSRRNSLIELGELIRQGEGDITEAIAEIINPSGHLMFRKGINILIFEEEIIKHSKFPHKGVQEITYMDFLNDIALVFDMAAVDPWVVFYGEPEPEPTPEEPKPVEPVSKPKPEPIPEPVSEPEAIEKKETKETPDNDIAEEDKKKTVETVEADIVETTDECKHCKGSFPTSLMTKNYYLIIKPDGYLEVHRKFKDGRKGDRVAINYCLICGIKLGT